MARAKQILEEHAEGHHALANLLIEREVITSEDVERILGPRPWKSRGDEILEEDPPQPSLQREGEDKLPSSVEN